ncbi:MAG: IclR family transcriptional regulator [Canibacter sp.]
MAAPVQSVLKAYRILDTFSASNAPSTIRQIAAKTGIPRSTVYDLCQTLVQTGQLEYVPGEGYQLGVRLVAMSGPVLEKLGLVEASEPSMNRLATLPSGAAFLSLFTYPWVTYIAFTHTRSKLDVQRKMGLRVPLHASGSGISILAELHDSTIEEYLEDLSEPMVSRVRPQVEEMRRHGYLVSKSFQRGLASISTSILGAIDAPIGALAFLENESKASKKDAMRIGKMLKEEALSISHRIRAAQGAY